MSQPPIVHIWSIPLDHPHWNTYTAVLNQDEQQRIQRYKTPALQQRQHNSRIALRLVLAHHTQQPAHQITLHTSPTGKPFLPEHPTQHFNLSHSGKQGIIAVSTTPVGIDIEHLKLTLDRVHNLASNVLPHEEHQHLLQQPTNQHIQLFYTLWTQKEAYLKAIGTGLSQSTHIIHTQYGQAVQNPQHPQHIPTLYTHPIHTDKHHIASLCIAHQQPNIQYHSLNQPRALTRGDITNSGKQNSA